jgi:hypothetical protein
MCLKTDPFSLNNGNKANPRRQSARAGLHSSEYQTRQRRAGCLPVSKDLEYAFFEV